MFAATDEYTRHSVHVTFSYTVPAPQDTCWHVGKSKCYPGMALREKLGPDSERVNYTQLVTLLFKPQFQAGA